MVFFKRIQLLRSSHLDIRNEMWLLPTLSVGCGYYPPYQSVRMETKVATPIIGRQINQVLNWVKGLADI